MLFPKIRAASTEVRRRSTEDLINDESIWSDSFSSTSVRSGAGVVVTEALAASLSTVSLAVRVIAETVSLMPWQVNKLSMYKDRPITTYRPDHHVNSLLETKPNPESTPFTFKQTITTHANYWGNGWAEIERNMMGQPIALWILEPWKCELCRSDNGKLYLKYYEESGRVKEISYEDVYHVPNAFTFNGLTGISTVALARNTIGLTKAQEVFGETFFDQGLIPSVVLSREVKNNAAAVKNFDETKLYRKWEDRLGGRKNNKMIVLDPGMKAEPLTLPLEDVQFLATRKFQTVELCKWFRVQPHKVMVTDNLSYNNLNGLQISSYQDSVQPWEKRLCEEADRKLFSGSSMFRTKFNNRELMRGDFRAISEMTKTQFSTGGITPNEIRIDSNRPPVEDGDEVFIPVNMQTVQRAVEDPVIEEGKGIPLDGADPEHQEGKD